MGLRAMGIADSIVNLAFGLTLGSVAVAFALAFGLGGRQPAERVLTDLIDKAKKEAKLPNPVKEPVMTPQNTAPVTPSASQDTASSLNPAAEHIHPNPITPSAQDDDPKTD